MMRQDLEAILAERLTSTDDEMRLILSGAMVAELRALRDLCDTALVGAC